MKVALICCGRLENRYAIEFIEYYKQLGFDHIYIADNNYDGEEYFEDVLQSYINNDFVTIYNYRNIIACQGKSYIEIYNEIKNDYDWVAFFDFDEFLTLVEDNNIKDYLGRDCFINVNQILINWKIYTDNDLLYDDGRPCLERFTIPMKNVYVSYNYCYENEHTKPIIRGNLNNIDIAHPHIVGIKNTDDVITPIVNNEGEEITNITKYNFSIVPLSHTLSYIKHFTTKTLEEWVNNKYRKGTGDRTFYDFIRTYPLERFFKINNITEEKLEYLKVMGVDISNLTREKCDKWEITW